MIFRKADMLNFVKHIFYRSCSIILNAALFMLFGAVVAFGFLATRPFEQTSRETSPALANFIDSSEKSKTFSVGELGAGVSHLIYKCATKGVPVPISPSFSANGDYLDVGLPVSVKFFSENLKLWAVVSLSFKGREVSVHSARIGDARLPSFAAKKISNSILGFYTPITSLKKYMDVLEKSKIEVLRNGEVRIEK